MKCAIRVFIAVLLAFSAVAEPGAVSPRVGMSPAQPRQFAEPPLRHAAVAAAEVQRLPKLEAFEIAAVRRANASRDMLQIGVVRSFTHETRVQPGLSAASAEPWKWRGAIVVEGGYELRAKLTNVDLPEDAVLWVYGTSGPAIGFDASTAFESTLWTPTVEGDRLTLEVSASRPGSFAIAAVADIRPEPEVSVTATECFRDVACQSSSVVNMATAIAQYNYVRTDGVYVCSGGLIIDAQASFTPYFLTANHCISTAAQAATVEAAWDYRATSCSGLPPSRASRPKSNGATLLVTSADSDVTLLRLSSVPGTRAWLGWDPNAVPAGAPLFRISHPNGGPQVYSTTTVETLTSACSARPRPRYMYENKTFGGTTGGSSGAPVIFGDGYIVGQLYGVCGFNLDNPCDAFDRSVDGAFSASYPLLKPFLNAGPQAACTPSAAKLCLNGNRFELTVSWRTNDSTGNGTAVPMTNDTGYFWFFGSSNVELVIKVLDGRPVNGKFWVFYGALSNVGYTLTVRDTQTGAVKTYVNPLNNLASVADTSAF